MEWTPRRIAAVQFVDNKLAQAARREAIMVHTVAARGDQKTIQKALKDQP